MTTVKPNITISIVSHGQAELIEHLLQDLQEICTEDFEIILTLNIPEELNLDKFMFPCPVTVHRNKQKLGFGENHNKAFSHSSGRYFCVLNPDIRLRHNPFPLLISQLDGNTGVVAPKVVNSEGVVEKSARFFPTPLTIVNKLLGRQEEKPAPDEKNPDWVAGMFMLFPAHIFKKVNGFDERYFLYYEDVDLCARLKLAGHDILYIQDVAVEHDAQWTSHSDTVYRCLHVTSMFRFFLSRPFFMTQKEKMITKLKFFSFRKEKKNYHK